MREETMSWHALTIFSEKILNDCNVLNSATWSYASDHANENVSFEARRRARRRHFKRIAAIVVDKWLAFSSARLRAARHYWRKMQLASLFAFKRAVTQAHIHYKNMLVLRSRFRYQRISKVLHTWLQVAHYRQLVRQISHVHHVKRQRRIQTSVMRMWLARTLEGRSFRRQEAKAVYFRNLILLSKGVRTLQAHVVRKRQSAWRLACAVNFRVYSLTQRAWLAFLDFLAFRAEKELHRELASRHAVRRRYSSVCLAWRMEVANIRTNRKQWIEFLENFRADATSRTLRTVISEWSAVASRSRTASLFLHRCQVGRKLRIKTQVLSRCAHHHRHALFTYLVFSPYSLCRLIFKNLQKS